MSERLGFSGTVAKAFLTSEITPLLALVGLLLGAFAVAVTPREEEPQINVTFANVFVPFPGASAQEVEQLVATPAEQVLSEIDGIKHVYSVSQPGMAMVTVRYQVGEDRTQAIVRLYNAIYSNQDWLPPNLGIGQPIIKPKGIDDVPIITLTLWTEDPQRGGYELQKVAHAIEAELKRVKGTRDIYTVGGPDQVVHVLLDPVAMAGHGIAVDDLRQSLQVSNSTAYSGNLVDDDREVLVQTGTFLTDADQIAHLVVGVHDGKPVYLRDVAQVRRGPDHPERYVWLGTGPAAGEKGIEARGEFPAVTVAVAKKPGTNAVAIAEKVIQRFEQLKGTFVPEGVHATVTRDYGVTADAKAKKLIQKLVFATAAVVLLVVIALGWREAIIVGAAVVVTLMITLFASWAWGFTLNRVSLFALIFSIGILVDDAIVVVENIHRHMQLGGRKLLEAIPYAVDEVGGPTILATFTVIAALLPMAFVTGLMGPYMSPIPINASFGMVISLAVAFVVTPWLTYKVLKGVAHKHEGGHHEEGGGWLYRLFDNAVRPFLRGKDGAGRRNALWLAIGVLIVASVSLAALKLVVLKMLPFDNRSEFQVVLEMPEGGSPERTARVLSDLTDVIRQVPEVTDYQVYAGTAAPINFNGLVRQYYLRAGSAVGDIQVNLMDKHHRDRSSHEVALALRPQLVEVASRYEGVVVKVVEVPPGPPVQSPLVAEVYGIDYEGQIRTARGIREVVEATPDIVDVDDSVEVESPKLIVAIDQEKAAILGVAQQTVVAALSAALSGEDASFLHGRGIKYPTPIRLELPTADKDAIHNLLALRVHSQSGSLVQLADLVTLLPGKREHAIYHKDLLPVVYVTADMAGELDSPLYGMFDIYARLGLEEVKTEDGYPLAQYFVSQPENPYFYSIKWDGEWQVTYETFRDMGIAYAVGMVLIYLLIVAQFKSYLVPLIIMAPIPLTVIGVMPGHALLGAQFTATSMIGMIALAGIIVRNSILLVDFINQKVAEGTDFEEAVVQSGAVRATPITLTGLAAMAGAFFILDDPIFSGLAISLIFGIAVSTLLTLVVIPVLYYAAMRKRMETGAVE
jgi:multidrug efflux pump subunit AcrB